MTDTNPRTISTGVPTGVLPILLLGLLFSPLPSGAATLVVDETTCTLIDAILAANTDSPSGGCLAGAGADTIVLTTDVNLTAAYETANGGTGLPTLNSEITLQGHGHTISRDGDAPGFRLMAIVGDGAVRLENVALRNGSTDDTDSLGGGAMITVGHVTLNGVTVSSNEAIQGGGIFNAQILFLEHSTVSDNSATEVGGGIANAGMLFANNSTVSSNSAGTDGGGLYSYLATAELTNCTVSGNSAGGTGGGLWGSDSYVALENSIVANSVSGGNCSGTSDRGNNFADDGTCGAGFGLLTGLDPLLAVNGGLTPTHALLPGSTAIDAAGDCGLATDQRGAPRNDGACDAGAYEFQCYIELEPGVPGTAISFVPVPSLFDLVTGDLAELRGDGSFADATCLGSSLASPVIDPGPDLDPGKGRYYLARGLDSCVGAGYGASSLDPDPRSALTSGPCP